MPASDRERLFRPLPQVADRGRPQGRGALFWYWRVGEDLDRIAKDRLHNPVQRYFHDNLWITTSAFFRDELLALALATIGEDRIMLSVDYPMASARAGADWFRAIDLPRMTKKKIAHRKGLISLA